jgi:NAD-dependent dihydropyrimidine dehydrogenase PreA subunit
MRERVNMRVARRDQSTHNLKASETMAYVITDACVKDFLCAPECSTNAIHPMSDEEGADAVSQLFINPDECIDCGSCVAVCPSDAIFPIDELPADKAAFAEKNAAHFQ